MTWPILFVCGIAGILTFSCEKGRICDEEQQTVKIQEFGDSTGISRYRLQHINEEETIVNLVINSQTDYEKYITCIGTSPAIDFTKHTLLAGRIKTTTIDHLDSQSVVRSCFELKYTVTIEEGVATQPYVVYYFALIAKTYIPVSFDVRYKQH